MINKDKDLRPEYPAELISSGARGPYAKRLREEASTLVRIDTDLRELFPDAVSVNRVLREYAERRKLLDS